jgi:polyketide cyclase/dehydrase/lipid transport protein
VNDVVWEIAHSVDANASPAFAWNYMTEVSNWDDPPAQFELNGPFAIGSRGTTRFPGQEPMHWHILSVRRRERYILEMPLDRAVVLFEWRFEALNSARTRLTQHIVLRGENAAAYVAQLESAFSLNLASGMNKIAMAMQSAEGRA